MMVWFNQIVRVFCFSFFLLIILISASAQASPKTVTQGNEIPESLKNIKPVGICRADDDVILQEHPTQITQVEALDADCGLSVNNIKTLLEETKTVLVDLRFSNEYQAFHVRNAVNLSLSEITVKPYLRSKTVILMNNGKLEAEVYRACSRLKKAGHHQVFVMQGGITNWILSGNEIDGKAVSPSDLAKITPAELWIEAQSSENNIFLDPSRESMRALLPTATVLSKTDPGEIRKLTNQSKSEHFLGVILVTSPSITHQQIQSLQQAVLPSRLLIYNGSYKDYTAYINQQKKIWLARAKGPKKLGCGL